MGDDKTTPTSRAVTRHEMELVIRRAVELATEQADAGEAISEEEVVRIAGEVGLSPQYVRQALFELPELRRQEQPTRAARTLGPCTISAQRAVPGEAAVTIHRLEQYLSTREYLLTRRHQGTQLWLAPAEDAVSKVFRAMTRANRRFQLARATRVGVSAEPLDAGRARVRLEIDLEERHHDAFIEGSVGGVFLGLGLGSGLGFTGAALAVVLGATGPLIVGSGIALGVAGLVGGIWGGLALARRSFRRRLDDARAEAEALLDRLEAGERLDPPPSPLLRRLRDRFIGSIPLR